MGNKQDYQLTLRSLRHIRWMARKLGRLPVDCLRVNGDDIADAEYVTEWLHIVLCRICGQPEVSMPPFDNTAPYAEQFRWFIKKAARQAKSLRHSLLLGRIEKELFAEKAWEGLDSVETFLGSFLSENVSQERRRHR